MLLQGVKLDCLVYRMLRREGGMKALIQRVERAAVFVGDRSVGKIGGGLLVFLGVEKDDQEQQLEAMVNKVLSYRVFSDEQGRMNLSLRDVRGELLVVSQFTLAANTAKGLRPSFSSAASPQSAKALYDKFIALAATQLEVVESGEFGADMKVSLDNDGPVTFILSV